MDRIALNFSISETTRTAFGSVRKHFYDLNIGANEALNITDKITSVSSTSLNYAGEVLEFLKELLPDFTQWDLLADLKGVISPTLNLMFELALRFYGTIRNNGCDLMKLLVAVANFYYKTLEYKSWTSLVVGFVDLVNTLFSFSRVPELLSLVTKTVKLYFDKLRLLFIRSESAESTVGDFWKCLEFKNDRNFLSILWNCTCVFTSISYIGEFFSSLKDAKSLESIMEVVNKHLVSKSSDLRYSLKDASSCLAKIYDFLVYNQEHLLTGNFSAVSWSLPLAVRVENDFANFMALYRRVVDDSSVLEKENLTWLQLRSKAQKIRNKLDEQIRSSEKGALHSAYVRYLRDIDGSLDYIQHRIDPENTKIEPLSVTFCGTPGCGKSCFATTCAKLMQKAAGREPNSDLHASVGGDPKFAVNINNDSEVIVFDDFANDTSRKVSPKEILDAVNVTREPIPKAGVDEKNKHRYSNIGTIFTTNDDQIGLSNIATVNKDSMLRRFGFRVNVGIKEHYCRSGTKNLDRHHPDVKDKFNPDVYDLSIDELVCVGEDGKIVTAPVDDWRMYPELDDYKNLVAYLQRRFANTWLSNTKSYNKSQLKEDLCSSCGLDGHACVCSLGQPHSEEKCDLVAESLSDRVDSLAQIFRNHSVSAGQLLTFADNSCLTWANVVSSSVVRKLFFARVLSLGMSTLVYLFQKRDVLLPLITLFMILTLCCPLVAALGVVLGWFYLLPERGLVQKTAALFVVGLGVWGQYDSITGRFGIALVTMFVLGSVYAYTSVVSLRNSMTQRYISTFTYIREHHRVRCAGYLAVCGLTTLGLLGIISLFVTRLISAERQRDPAVAVTPMDDMDPHIPITKKTNDNNVARYRWLPFLGEKAKTVSLTDAHKFIGKRTVIIKISSSEGVTVVRGVPMGSEIMVPFHAFPKHGLFDVELSANPSERTAASKMKSVPLTRVERMKDLNGNYVDAALFNYTGMPTKSNLDRFFNEQTDLPVFGAGRQLHKTETGEVEFVPVRLKTTLRPVHYSDADTEYVARYAYSVTAQHHTSSCGDCGSPILAEDTNCIVGIHIAGSQTNTWYALKITKAMIENARHALKQRNKYAFVSHPKPEAFLLKDNQTNLSFDPLGADHAVEGIGLHASPIEEIGHMYKNGAPYVDKATNHYFKNANPAVSEIFGPPNSRPPVAPNGKAQINTALEKLANPTFDCPINLMERAADDYLNGECNGVSFNTIIRDLKEQYGENFFSVRSVEEAARGDETGIIRGLNNNSSAGFVYGGSKKKHMDMDVEGDPLEVRKFLPYIQEAIDHQEREWRQGRGTYDPFKRCSKVNELLPWDKAAEKTRSFYGNDIVFNLNATRGIIPLKHILRTNMEHTECFVGVVAQSSQWKALQNFVSKDGQYDRFVCGDFSGYDTQLPKSLLDTASAILIELLRRGGMSETDLEFVRGALSSVVSPTLIWDGHVLCLANGQPSGQPLTVELNSIMNSLLMRMAFYSIADNEGLYKLVNFRDYVRLATYGDDNLLGVSAEIAWFNHTRIQAEFAKWRIKYTMADKNADSVPYQSLKEVSFLKRAFAEHSVLGVVAPIEKESIIKKFYYWVRLSNTPLSFPEQFVDNFNCSVREAYLHGEEYFLEFCDKIKRLQESTMTQPKEFQVEWHRITYPTIEEMRAALKPAYGL